MTAFQKIRARIIELADKGENNRVIATQMGLKTSEINSILDEYRNERPKPQFGFEFCKQLAKEAGFDVSKDDLLRYKEKLTIGLSDEELENVAGGDGTVGWCCEVMGSIVLNA
jgi:hypothetical protein